jgi:signal transduction histidine kinase
VAKGQRALAVLPMLARGQVAGVLRVGFLEPRRFDSAERSFLEALASQAGLALERARGYEAEQRARAEASRVGALQEQLLAVVGHDLRTPLTAISMSASLLLRRGGLAPDQAQGVARIAQGAGRMAGLIRDLLDFSRLRQGLALSLRPEPADLALLAREVVQEHEAAGAAGRVALVATGDLSLQGDPVRLAQVLTNLVGNALQHGAGTPVRLALSGQGDEVLLCVQNGGPPIPPSLLPHVFDPFRHGGAGHVAGSVGLGLFIVREIVDAHGGAVEVRSSEAEGTSFAVRFPRRGPAQPDAGGPAASHAAASPAQRLGGAAEAEPATATR